jgi:signal peptidase I
VRQSTNHPVLVRPQPQELLTRGSAVANHAPLRDRAVCELIAASLQAGHNTRIRVTGTSMLPAIWPRDVLMVSPSDQTSLIKGKIVLLLRDGRLCAHRVVSKLEHQTDPRLLTRGDAHINCDPPFAASEIVGTVMSINRGGREVPITSSPARRLLSFGIRHSDLMRRVALKIHSIRRRSWAASATQCRA